MGTGSRRDTITRLIEQFHARYADVMDGALANYIPELTQADPRHFGIALVTADGLWHVRWFTLHPAGGGRP